MKIKELEEKLKAKTDEAEKLKEEYLQLEERRNEEIKQLDKKYQKKINELEEIVRMRKEQADLKEENFRMKYKSEYQDREIQHLKEENKLRLEIKDLETKLAQKETEVQQCTVWNKLD